MVVASRPPRVTREDRTGPVPGTLQYAAWIGDQDGIDTALRDGEFGVNHKDSQGRDALMCACAGGHLELVRFLVAHGADPTHTDHLSLHALTYAADHGHLAVVQWLLQAENVRATCILNITDYADQCPILRAAIARAPLGILELLVGHPATDLFAGSGTVEVVYQMLEGVEKRVKAGTTPAGDRGDAPGSDIDENAVAGVEASAKSEAAARLEGAIDVPAAPTATPTCARERLSVAEEAAYLRAVLRMILDEAHRRGEIGRLQQTLLRRSRENWVGPLLGHVSPTTLLHDFPSLAVDEIRRRVLYSKDAPTFTPMDIQALLNLLTDPDHRRPAHAGGNYWTLLTTILECAFCTVDYTPNAHARVLASRRRRETQPAGAKSGGRTEAQTDASAPVSINPHHPASVLPEGWSRNDAAARDAKAPARSVLPDACLGVPGDADNPAQQRRRLAVLRLWWAIHAGYTAFVACAAGVAGVRDALLLRQGAALKEQPGGRDAALHAAYRRVAARLTARFSLPGGLEWGEAADGNNVASNKQSGSHSKAPTRPPPPSLATLTTELLSVREDLLAALRAAAADSGSGGGTADPALPWAETLEVLEGIDVDDVRRDVTGVDSQNRAPPRLPALPRVYLMELACGLLQRVATGIPQLVLQVGPNMDYYAMPQLACTMVFTLWLLLRLPRSAVLGSGKVQGLLKEVNASWVHFQRLAPRLARVTAEEEEYHRYALLFALMFYYSQAAMVVQHAAVASGAGARTQARADIDLLHELLHVHGQVMVIPHAEETGAVRGKEAGGAGAGHGDGAGAQHTTPAEEIAAAFDSGASVVVGGDVVAGNAAPRHSHLLHAAPRLFSTSACATATAVVPPASSPAALNFQRSTALPLRSAFKSCVFSRAIKPPATAAVPPQPTSALPDPLCPFPFPHHIADLGKWFVHDVGDGAGDALDVDAALRVRYPTEANLMYAGCHRGLAMRSRNLEAWKAQDVDGRSEGMGGEEGVASSTYAGLLTHISGTLQFLLSLPVHPEFLAFAARHRDALGHVLTCAQIGADKRAIFALDDAFARHPQLVPLLSETARRGWLRTRVVHAHRDAGHRALALHEGLRGAAAGAETEADRGVLRPFFTPLWQPVRWVARGGGEDAAPADNGMDPTGGAPPPAAGDELISSEVLAAAADACARAERAAAAATAAADGGRTTVRRRGARRRRAADNQISPREARYVKLSEGGEAAEGGRAACTDADAGAGAAPTDAAACAPGVCVPDVVPTGVPWTSCATLSLKDLARWGVCASVALGLRTADEDHESCVTSVTSSAYYEETDTEDSSDDATEATEASEEPVNVDWFNDGCVGWYVLAARVLGCRTMSLDDPAPAAAAHYRHEVFLGKPHGTGWVEEDRTGWFYPVSAGDAQRNLAPGGPPDVDVNTAAAAAAGVDVHECWGWASWSPPPTPKGDIICFARAGEIPSTYHVGFRFGYHYPPWESLKRLIARRYRYKGPLEQMSIWWRPVLLNTRGEAAGEDASDAPFVEVDTAVVKVSELEATLARPLRVTFPQEDGGAPTAEGDPSHGDDAAAGGSATTREDPPPLAWVYPSAQAAALPEGWLLPGEGGAAAATDAPPDPADCPTQSPSMLKGVLTGTPGIGLEFVSGLTADAETKDFYHTLAARYFGGVGADALFSPCPEGVAPEALAFHAPPANATPTVPRLQQYFAAGRLLGYAVIRQFDVGCLRLARGYYKTLLAHPLTLSDVAYIDAGLHRSLQWVLRTPQVERVTSLYFVYRETPLVANGAARRVTDANKREFVELTARAVYFAGVETAFHAFASGFWMDAPAPLTKWVFTAEGLERAFAHGARIDAEAWEANTAYEVQEMARAPVVRWFWRYVRAAAAEEGGVETSSRGAGVRLPALAGGSDGEVLRRYQHAGPARGADDEGTVVGGAAAAAHQEEFTKVAKLLKFATGYSSLPPGGFPQLAAADAARLAAPLAAADAQPTPAAAHAPALTITTRATTQNGMIAANVVQLLSDDELTTLLPTAHPCTNTLYIPPYTSYEQLAARFDKALAYGHSGLEADPDAAHMQEVESGTDAALWDEEPRGGELRWVGERRGAGV